MSNVSDEKVENQVFSLIGDIKLGDTPLKIKTAKKDQDGSVRCLIEWNRRSDGYQPEDSFVLNTELRKKYSDVLLDFYESRLKFNNSNN